MTTTDDAPSIDDPFFAVIPDGLWNACVGRQGDEQNYVDGYIEAAIELASAVVDKELIASRDTLAMPILYNGRHGLELALKFAIGRLHTMGALAAAHSVDHDILSHWAHLRNARVGDAAVRDLVERLGRFVESLAGIDADGQELRYATSRNGARSLAGLAVINLPLVRVSLQEMGALLGRLKIRVLELEDERRTGTFTRDCSRSDLKRIAGMLGDHATWREEGFQARKAEVRDAFGLSSGKFSDAVDGIRASRELAQVVGIETGLRHLRDETAVFAITEWSLANPVREVVVGDPGLSVWKPDWDEMREHARVSRKLDDAIVAAVALEEFCELEALFYIGRGPEFGESYDEVLDQTLAKHRRTGMTWEVVHHIMSKTNLLDCVMRACRIVGRASLADKLRFLPLGGERKSDGASHGIQQEGRAAPGGLDP